MTVIQAAEKWGCSAKRVNAMCREGLVPGARKDGSRGHGKWLVPDSAQKPRRRKPPQGYNPTPKSLSTDGMKSLGLSQEEKVAYIRRHSSDRTYGQMEILLDMTHAEIRAVYDDLFARGTI